MSPENQRERLEKFFKNETDIYDNIFERVKNERFKIVSSHLQNIPNLDDFTTQHYSAIEDQANKVLNELCKKIIPKNQFTFLFTQISLFAIFLLPPIYPLIRYSIHLWKEPNLNITEFSACLASACLLLVLMGAAAWGVFTTSFPKDKT